MFVNQQEQYLFKAAKKHFCCFLSIKWFLSIVYSWDLLRKIKEDPLQFTPMNVFDSLECLHPPQLTPLFNEFKVEVRRKERGEREMDKEGFQVIA